MIEIDNFEPGRRLRNIAAAGLVMAAAFSQGSKATPEEVEAWRAIHRPSRQAKRRSAATGPTEYSPLRRSRAKSPRGARPPAPIADDSDARFTSRPWTPVPRAPREDTGAIRRAFAEAAVRGLQKLKHLGQIFTRGWR